MTYSAPGIRTYSTRPDMGDVFSPADIAGLQLWLKADAITGLVDSDPVSQWDDSSGNGNHGTATLTTRPLYKTSILNSLPIVRFDGSNDRLNIPDVNGLDLTGDQTIFAVFLSTDISGGIVTHYNALSPFTGWGFGLGVNTPAGDGKLAYWSTTKGAWVNSTGTVHNGAGRLGAAIRTSGSLTFYIDGTASGTTTGHGNGSSTDAISIGSLAGATGFFAGDIAEILVYDSALTGTNLTNLKAYIAAKYALTIA